MANKQVTNFRSGLTQLDIRTTENKKIIFPVLGLDLDPCGECMIITDNSNHAVIIDTSRDEYADNVIYAISNAGVKTIDAVFISHWHGDHYANLEKLALYFDCSNTLYYLARPSTLLPGSSSLYANFNTLYGDRAITPTNGSQYEHLGITFTCYNCSATDISYYEANSSDYNDCSMVIDIKYHGDNAIYTADVSGCAQERCVQQGYIHEADLITWPHHGVDSASNSSFFEELHPSLVYMANSNQSMVFSTFRDPNISMVNAYADIYTNSDNRHTPVCFTMTGYGIAASGSSLSVSRYADAQPTIYCDPTVADDAVQNGSVEHPYKSLRRAVSSIKYGAVIELINDFSDTVVINGQNGPITINANGHVVATALTLLQGAICYLNGGSVGSIYLYTRAYGNFDTVTITELNATDATFYCTNCTFTGTQPVRGTRSIMIFNAPVCTGRTGLFINATNSIISGFMALGSMGAATPFISNNAGYTNFNRLSSPESILTGIFSPVGAPVIMFDTNTNKLIHIDENGTVHRYSQD